jgi:cation-transporting ATPase E
MGSVERPPTPLAAGLSAEDVEARRRLGQDNSAREKTGKSVGRILRDNLLTLFNLLNLALAAAVVAVGSFRNALFMGVVASNAVIGTVQEIRARRAVEKLKLVIAPAARVIRDGRPGSIPVEQLVLDDLILLETGDQIPVDAQVREGVLEVDESLLTGESLPVRRGPGELLRSGSFAVAGKCVAQARRVGADTYAAAREREAKVTARPSSELMRSLNALIRFLSFLIVPVGVALFIRQFRFGGASLQDSVVGSVAAMVGMIPEGLVLLTSVALAVGVVRLARRKTLVQSLYSMEDLARVDVLCLDKTGTLTSGNLCFDRLEPLGGDESECARLLGAALHAVGGLDATSRALMPRFPAPDCATGRTAPFSSARKWSGAEVEGAAVILGAPQFVLPGMDGALERRIAALTSEGARVLMLARSEGPLPEEGLPPDLAPLALVLLTDEVRPEAGETLAFFAREDVEIKVISGDDARTAAAVARRAGVRNADRYIDVSALPDEDAIRDAATRHSVFGRVTPQEKRLIVRALKEAGHTVAMTGDGVNDIPALKEADCSIAMASGSDAARHVASLVLLDCNFASLPEVVMEGRRVIGNLRRSASLFLTKTVFSFLLSLLSLATGAGYPFVPIQLTLFSSAAVGIPSFLLALEPNRARAEGRFFPYVLSRALPGGLIIALGAWALSAFGAARGLTPDETGTLATLYLMALGLAVLFTACRPLNARRAMVFMLSALILSAALLFFPGFFELTPLSAGSLRALGLLTAAAVPGYAALNLVISRIFRRISAEKSLHP